MFDSIKSKILNHSDSYIFYKTKCGNLSEEIDILKSKNNELLERNIQLEKNIASISRKIDEKMLLKKMDKFNKELTILKKDKKQIINKMDTFDKNFEKISKKNDNTNKILDSYNHQFKTIFFDYDLKPKGLVKYFQKLGWELLFFITNICIKHDLNCWLDFGTLLGAIRHGYFIPWDDDLDMGMMREDFNKLLEILPNEIKLYGLDDNIKWYIDVASSKKWVQSFLKIYYFPKKGTYIGLDIFPYDFLMEKTENTSKLYDEEKYYFNKKIIDGVERTKAEYDYYKKLGLSYETAPFVIPGVDGVRGPGFGEYSFDILETNEIFPLKTLKLQNRELKCPKNHDYYLKSIFGDYYQLPKNIHHHDVIEQMHKIPESEKYFKMHSEKLERINNDILSELSKNSI